MRNLYRSDAVNMGRQEGRRDSKCSELRGLTSKRTDHGTHEAHVQDESGNVGSPDDAKREEIVDGYERLLPDARTIRT